MKKSFKAGYGLNANFFLQQTYLESILWPLNPKLGIIKGEKGSN